MAHPRAKDVYKRQALIFGGVQPGDLAGLLKYTKERVPAFVNTFGALNEVVVSAGAGAIALGFPVVADIDLGDMQVPGALESETDHAHTVKTVSYTHLRLFARPLHTHLRISLARYKIRSSSLTTG